MKKADALKVIEKAIPENEVGNIQIYYDKKWRYPHSGDDFKTCPLLKAMFDIEYKSGLIIFIPDAANRFGQPGNRERNSEEG